jgi:methylenetetrahydrofolate dehydrogenase (NADP+)/methenyltetrahydrofolate cyclohydrolase
MLKEEGIVPATPKGIMRLLDEYHVDLKGKNALVIGRSILVGNPVAQLLLQRDATVTIAHSKTKNLKELCQTMDIIVSAVGKPKTITEDMVKEGAVIVDVGINRVLGTLVGDVDYLLVSPKTSRITPVPGGVGPMTIACLLENVMACYRLQNE